MKIIVLAGAALCWLLSGCTGARVTETTTAAGNRLTNVRVSAGTVLSFNQQTGTLCIDAAGAKQCGAEQ